ncbi:MAG: zinc ribbon domain-containing protein [Candidatus Bathyarchaeota archaeon]|nr:MAG: zinc ribbon domain-containing protein [Candidatus Bathyarchaeota archaeon]
MVPIPIGQVEWWGWGLAGIFCLIPIVWFIIAILLCVWVYRDAESRGMSGGLWLIIVIITGILGLIIYLIVRKDKQGPAAATAATPVTRVCTSCGRAVSPGVKFCPHCGKEIPE